MGECHYPEMTWCDETGKSSAGRMTIASAARSSTTAARRRGDLMISPTPAVNPHHGAWSRRLADRVAVGDVDELVTAGGCLVVGIHADEAAHHRALRRARGDGERDGAGLAGTQCRRRVEGAGRDRLRPDV